MEKVLTKLHKQFPSISQKSLMKIYKARLERIRLLKMKGIPPDICWVIEARVRLAGEYSETCNSYLTGFGRSTYAKKRRAKRMGVCFKYAHWNCNTRCHSLGMVSDNREDKIKFIRDGLSKESIDDISSTLETHPSGYVHIAIHKLHAQFRKERQQLSLGNLTQKDPVCQFIRKSDGKLVPDA